MNNSVIDNGPALQAKNTNSSLPLKLYGGWNLNQDYAVEAGYARFSSAYDKADLGSSENLHIDAHVAYLAGKRSFAIGERFSLHAKLGIARNVYRIGGDPARPKTMDSVRLWSDSVPASS